MTSINPHDAGAHGGGVGHPDGPDPVHPALRERTPPHTSVTTHEQSPEPPHGAEPPAAAGLGSPAVLDHRVVAVQVGATACPVAVHRWTGDAVGTWLFTPTQAQVWARAGRLTLVTAEGREYRLTVLAPEECAEAVLGEHWPLHEPERRMRRIASAAVHDVGELLAFPAWLARTAHLSGERNRELARLVLRIRTASPGTAVYYGQTFGHLHPRPGQHHPYDHRGLVGHEGWPREL
jgi:hypothetical protein